MRFYYFLTIPLVLLLCSCAGLKIKEPTLVDNVYLDADYPRIRIEFPFKVRYIDQNNDFSDFAKSITRRLYSDETSTTVFLRKDNIIQDHVIYTETDSSQFSNNLYMDDRKNGFCTVGFYEKNLNTYLRGMSYRYDGRYGIALIETYKKLGYVSSVDQYKDKNRAMIDHFIEDMKLICSQNVRVKD